MIGYLTLNTFFAIVLILSGSRGLVAIWERPAGEVWGEGLVRLAQIALGSFLVVITLVGALEAAACG